MIEIKNIVKNYITGDTIVNALQDVSICFRESEFVSILGQSGCGKTTLLNILGGLDRYDSGDLIINGKSTKEFKDKDWDSYRNHHVGFVFQNYNLIMHLSVVENVELALTIAGLNKKERREKAIEALKQVGLEDQIYKKPNQLSGGQMQRVSIARAIVNNPEIILADEPTGALDSETSVQVMDILKQISNNHLVIMVTHNKELAEQYSTRIINILDGKMISDTNPFEYTPPQEDNEKQTTTLEQTSDEQPQKTKDKKVKSAMGFWTALRLSFKNLLTKKGRTFMTSFAGSIGIVGIALILAVSNGFTGYINNLQSNTLSGYPIAVSTIAVDMETIMAGDITLGKDKDENQFPDLDHVIVDTPQTTVNLASMAHYNYLSPAFLQYIKEFEQQDAKRSEDDKLMNAISYSCASPLVVITKQNDDVKKIATEIENNPLTGDISSIFYEGLDNPDFVKSQYDLLYGKYPQNKNEVALVITKNNKISQKILNKLGFETPLKADGETYEEIKFSDICGENGVGGKEYQIVLNDQFYNPIYDGETLKEFGVNDVTTLYDHEKNIKLKVTAVLRVKESSPMEIYSTGIAYSPELTKYISEIERQSLVVKTQLASTEKIYIPFAMEVATIKESFDSISKMKAYVALGFNVELSTELCNEYALQMLGASSIPIGIKIYPKNFDAKDKITTYLSEWNTTDEGKTNYIKYSDATEMLSSTMGQMVNIISYVLIAFAAISLIVSSVMIGIITYASVIERTKEIGVLRSIGARKKDISRVFNAETMLIGVCSGLIGVLLAFALTFPISAIIKAVAGGAIAESLAVLDPLAALILVVISTSLTLISGLVPSRIAAKKDPVKALRSE